MFVCIIVHQKVNRFINRIKFHLLNQLCYAASAHWLTAAASSYSIHNQPLTHSDSQLWLRIPLRLLIYCLFSCLPSQLRLVIKGRLSVVCALDFYPHWSFLLLLHYVFALVYQFVCSNLATAYSSLLMHISVRISKKKIVFYSCTI